MARYKYLGEPPRPGLTYEAMTQIRGIGMHGTLDLFPVPPATEFEVGKDIGHDITDPILIQVFDADPRYERVP